MKNNRSHQFHSLAFLAAAFVACGNSLPAQALIASLPSENSGATSATITGTLTGSTKLKSGQTRFGEVSSQEVTASFNQKLSLFTEADLGLGLTYGRMSFDRAGGAVASPIPERLQSLTFDLSYAHRFDDSWSGNIGVSPGYRSTGAGLSSDGFSLSAAAVGVYRVNRTLALAVGTGFDSLAGGHKYRGALAVDWNPSQSWHVTFGYPKTAVTYAFSDALEFSVFVEGNHRSYSVGQDPQPGLPGTPSLQHTKLDYSDTRIGFGTTYEITPRFVLTGIVGTVADRQFDYHQRDFKLRADQGAIYGSLGLACRF